MNPTAAVRTLTEVEPATTSEWPDKISSAWQKSVEGIIETGQLLIEAKINLPHGEFTKMIKNRLPFSEQTARKLMAVASDERIVNHALVRVLPSSWGTLYELTKLDDNT